MQAKKRVLGMVMLVLSATWISIHEAAGQDAPTYSIDYQGPPRGAPPAATFLGGPVPCIKEGDILLAPFILPVAGPDPPPNPNVAITGGPRRAGANLGLPDDPAVACPAPGVATGFEVEVDALSYGVDLLLLRTRMFPVNLSFSVDEFALGIPGAAGAPNVTTQGAAGTLEAAADVYVGFPPIPPGTLFPAPPLAVPPGNTQLFDGNGVAPPAAILPPLPCGGGPCALGLAEPLPPGPGLPDPCPNLDALDVDTIEPSLAAPPFPVYFSLDEDFDDPLEGPAVAPPNTGSALGNFGASGAAVFVTFPSGVTAMFTPGPPLGLDIAGGFGTDDLDALALAENGDMVFQPSLSPFDWVDGSTDMLLFSVRRASVVIGLPDSCFGLPIAPGDVLTTPLAPALGGVSPFPCIFYAAENLGLCTVLPPRPAIAGCGRNDDLDALDISLDCNGNLIPDILDISYGIAPDVDGDKFIDTCCPATPASPTVAGRVCVGGVNAGLPCTVAADCPGGVCGPGTEDTCHAGAVNIGTPCTTDAGCAVGQVCGLKSRYISIVPPRVIPECPALAIQVTVAAMPAVFAGVVGDVWWAGPSQAIPNAPDPGLTGAQLQCVPTEVPVPNVQSWPAGTLHLFGAITVPDASYAVAMCKGLGGPCSAPLTVDTGEWGDIVAPFGGASQPNFGDISADVAKFTVTAGAPSTPRADLVGVGAPATPNIPNRIINFADISADVAAFGGGAYPYTAPACP